MTCALGHATVSHTVAHRGSPAVSPAAGRRSQPPMSERLDREWRRLCRQPSILATVAGWGIVDPGEAPLADLDDLLARTGASRTADGRAARSGRATARVDDETANELLRRLLEVAAHDALAARIVLQRILPGLLTVVRVEQFRGHGVDAFDVLLAEAWVSIVSYPTTSRVSDIAARLLHDARHRAFTNPRRRRRVSETLCAPDRLAEPARRADRSAFEELTTLLGQARDGGLPARDVEVLAGIVNHGSSARLAAVLCMDQRSIRYRRDQAVKRVRQVLREPQLLPIGPRPSRMPA